jgi:hypothetical protein
VIFHPEKLMLAYNSESTPCGSTTNSKSDFKHRRRNRGRGGGRVPVADFIGVGELGDSFVADRKEREKRRVMRREESETGGKVARKEWRWAGRRGERSSGGRRVMARQASAFARINSLLNLPNP